jgi:AraC-like DNA-binding protein
VPVAAFARQCVALAPAKTFRAGAQAVKSKPRAEQREVELARASREELAEHIMRHRTGDGTVEQVPGLFLSRFSAPTGPIYGVSEPSFCVIAQGRKELLVGKERYRYDAFHYLLVSAGLPYTGHVVEASKERPYVGLRVLLDPALISAVLIDANHRPARPTATVRALAVSKIGAALLDAVVRLVRLVDTPEDHGMLAPLITREIVYRLLLGEQGGQLRQIAAVGASESRMSKAIELIRNNYDKPLSIGGVAKKLGMSVSGFHHHFKSATAMSPLQFQKHLRLQEARRLLVADDFDAATAAYRVGYDDPSHFSRDYKRLFGEPPMRDVERLRAQS